MASYRPSQAQGGSGSGVVRDRQGDAMADFRARRLHRRLEELERTNPTDIPASSFVPSTSTPLSISGTPTPGLGVGVQPAKKKQSGNVRRILYARKNLKDWLEELPSDPKPPYLSAAAPPPVTPPRKLCSSCGYIGAYRCQRCGEWSCDMTCMGVHERDGGCGVGG